jgi:hypothetical protein
LAINDSGAVVGWGADEIGNPKGYIYSQGVYTELMPPGCMISGATAINDSGAVVGWGTISDNVSEKGFIAIPVTNPLTPLEQIMAIMGFFDSNVASGNLRGIGKIEQAAAGKVKAFRNMLVQAQCLIENENTEVACGLLMEAYKKVDGTSRPPDFIGGSVAPELAAKIDALIKDLNCL